MEDTFDHLFGGMKNAPAKRWHNPDGRGGGIVALDAILPPSLTVPHDAVVWPGVSIGSGVTIGGGAIIGYRATICAGARVSSGAVIGCRASIADEVSIGYRASIGEGASIGHRASVGGWAVVCDGASIGYRASIGGWTTIGSGTAIGRLAAVGDGVTIDRNDWWMAGGPCGSRGTFWTAVFSAEHGLRWWVGCQRGITTDKLLERLGAVHGANSHGDDYRAAIAFVESHPGLARARAEKL